MRTLTFFVLLWAASALIGQRRPMSAPNCISRGTFNLAAGRYIEGPVVFAADDVQIRRMLGKIDVTQSNGKSASMRVFEAIHLPSGQRTFLKEYSRSAASLGKKELQVSRKSIDKFNEREKKAVDLAQEEDRERKEQLALATDTEIPEYVAEAIEQTSREIRTGTDEMVPGVKRTSSTNLAVPLLLGMLRTDDRIEEQNFQREWRANFPGIASPEAGNIWLIFAWDEFAFRSLRSYPPLPQIVEGLDYFREDKRNEKRWKFVRKVMLRTLESIHALHGSGFCHNSLNSDSLWLSTTNQQEMDYLYVKITDLGACQSMKELGKDVSRILVVEDFYALGFVFLELIFSSFNEEPSEGAAQTRSRLSQAALNEEMFKANAQFNEKKREGFESKDSEAKEQRNLQQRLRQSADGFDQTMMANQNNQKSLSETEFVTIFESYCKSDFKAFRNFFRQVPAYRDSFACKYLDENNGLAWKLIFKMLSRGRLYDDSKQKQMKISGKRFIKSHQELFNSF